MRHTVDLSHASRLVNLLALNILCRMQADTRIFNQGRWSVREDNRDLHTLHHLGSGVFAVASDVVTAKR